MCEGLFDAAPWHQGTTHILLAQVVQFSSHSQKPVLEHPVVWVGHSGDEHIMLLRIKTQVHLHYMPSEFHSA